MSKFSGHISAKTETESSRLFAGLTAEEKICLGRFLAPQADLWAESTYCVQYLNPSQNRHADPDVFNAALSLVTKGVMVRHKEADGAESNRFFLTDLGRSVMREFLGELINKYSAGAQSAEPAGPLADPEKVIKGIIATDVTNVSVLAPARPSGSLGSKFAGVDINPKLWIRVSARRDEAGRLVFQNTQSLILDLGLLSQTGVQVSLDRWPQAKPSDTFSTQVLNYLNFSRPIAERQTPELLLLLNSENDPQVVVGLSLLVKDAPGKTCICMVLENREDARTLVDELMGNPHLVSAMLEDFVPNFLGNASLEEGVRFYYSIGKFKRKE